MNLDNYGFYVDPFGFIYLGLLGKYKKDSRGFNPICKPVVFTDKVFDVMVDYMQKTNMKKLYISKDGKTYKITLSEV